MARVAKVRSLEAQGIRVMPVGVGKTQARAETEDGSQEKSRPVAPLAALPRVPEAPGPEGQAEVSARQHDLERQRALVQRVISQLAAERDRLLAQTRAQVLALATEVGKRIVRAELKVNEGVIERVLDEALESLRNCQAVKIRVHPSEARLAQAAIRAKEGVPAGAHQVELVRDATVSPGGCLVDTDAGTVDARVEAQLAALEEAILEEATGAD
ncbi:MAG: FliH/SctL family protein [Armatimonadota bacterium]